MQRFMTRLDGWRGVPVTLNPISRTSQRREDFEDYSLRMDAPRQQPACTNA